METNEDFYYRLGRLRTSEDPAERIAAAIWTGVTDRRGWRQEADQFDNEVRGEILDTWADIVRRFIPPA